MYPYHRPRRLRTNESIRSMVRETILRPEDFIAPLFIMEGHDTQEEISSMKGFYRMTLDRTVAEVKELFSMGIRSVLLFVKVPDGLKDNIGNETFNADGFMQQSIKAIKDACPAMIVMTDVAFDPYSSFGHDGIVQDNQIVNDKTVAVLSKMALSHAQAGADIVAPSDMMDGRIEAIRKILEENNFVNTGIMSYSAKYASSFYGPFRDALDSAPGFGDKKTYQMDYHNITEAIRETKLDIAEGADIVMVKPGMPYLDVVRAVKEFSEIPVSVYQVSGEYAMIKAASAQGWLNHDAVMLESLVSFKRAGADLIASYFAKDAVRLL